jgi:hypothetical protein
MIVVATVFLAATNCQPPNARPLPSAILKQRLRQAQTRIWAWEIEYESQREIQPGVPAVTYVHRIVAAKAPDKFFSWAAHGTPSVDWRDDPYQQRLTITGNRMITERPLDRQFSDQSLPPDASLPGSAPNEILLTALGWWPLTERPPPILLDNVPTALSRVAESPAYEARSRLEKAGDRWCYVLENPGLDQLWLDADRNHALVARQYSPSGQGQIQRFEFADFRELLPGTWVPFTLRNLRYECTSDGKPGRVLVDARLTFLRVRLNEEVDDARFRFHALPGSRGRFNDEPLRQTAPGGEEYLNEVVDWTRRNWPEKRIPASQWYLSDILIGTVIGALATVIILLIWDRCRGRQTRGGEPIGRVP